MAKLSRELDEFLNANPEWGPFIDLIVLPPSASDILEEFADAEGCDLLKRDDCWVKPRISMYALYLRIRREGETHKWAEMLALGSPPQIMTDAVYFAGHPGRFEDMHPIERAGMLAAAKRRGFTPGPGDVYSPSLAQFPGDPLAFIPPTGGRAHIRKVCEMRGIQCEGSVTTKYRQPERDPFESAVPMAPDVIRDNAVKLLEKNPALRRKKPQEIRDMVLAAHGPSK